MDWKPSATANDWHRWQDQGRSPPVKIVSVRVEGVCEGRRVVFDATAHYLSLLANAGASQDARPEAVSHGDQEVSKE